MSRSAPGPTIALAETCPPDGLPDRAPTSRPNPGSARRGCPLIRDRDAGAGCRGCDRIGDPASLTSVRRASRERIYEAQRTGVRNRLRDGWLVSEEMAEAIVAQWEIEAVRRALDRDDPRYWDEADSWIQVRFPQGGRAVN
jgi:hypothetical protein